MKMIALVIILFATSPAFANSTCQSLFENSIYSEAQKDIWIRELYGLRKIVLNSSGTQSTINRQLFVSRMSELKQIMSESEITERLRAVVIKESQNSSTKKTGQADNSEVKQVLDFMTELGVTTLEQVWAKEPGALVRAIQLKREDLVEKLLKFGVDPNVEYSNENRDVARFTALYAAIRSGSEKIVRLMIEYGARVNDDSYWNGDTSLHAVAMTKNPEIAKLLLAQPNIKMNAENKDGNTALEVALELQNYDVAKLLIEHGENPGKYMSKLAFIGATGELKKLLEIGADTNAIVRDSSNTALMQAAGGHKTDIVIMLLQNGADPHPKNNRGQTALDKAMEYKHMATKGEKPGTIQILKNAMKGKMP